MWDKDIFLIFDFLLTLLFATVRRFGKVSLHMAILSHYAVLISTEYECKT